MVRSDQELIDLLRRDADSAVRVIFEQYYKDICIRINRMIKNKAQTEDLAQELFLDFWKKRNDIEIKGSLKGYLSVAARNKTLNWIKSNKNHDFNSIEDVQQATKEESAQKLMELEEMKTHIDEAIDLLPEKCKIVFILSRFEQLSYKEIAKNLDISPKTVENQISKALKLLRMKLQKNN